MSFLAKKLASVLLTLYPNIVVRAKLSALDPQFFLQRKDQVKKGNKIGSKISLSLRATSDSSDCHSSDLNPTVVEPAISSVKSDSKSSQLLLKSKSTFDWLNKPTPIDSLSGAAVATSHSPSSTPPPPFPKKITKELLNQYLNSETQPLNHLQPFYVATVKRLLYLQGIHGKENVKLSFIILDWDETLHSLCLKGESSSDKLVSDILLKVMTERKVTKTTTSTSNGKQMNQRDIIIVPFPIIITCHGNYLNMMFGSVLERQKMYRTFDLVMGKREDTKVLAELELDGTNADKGCYQVVNKGEAIKNIDNNLNCTNGYSASSYTLPELIDKLKEDEVIPSNIIGDRLRAYDSEDRSLSIGTSWNNNLRNLSQWFNWKSLSTTGKTLYTPEKLRFELVPEIRQVNSLNDRTATTTGKSQSSFSRLSQIPFISIDRDIWFGYFLTVSGPEGNKFHQNNSFEIAQSLAFKREMYKKSFHGLVEVLKRLSPGISISELSSFIWDIVSIGDNLRDHSALAGILQLAIEEVFFSDGVDVKNIASLGSEKYGELFSGDRSKTKRDSKTATSNSEAEQFNDISYRYEKNLSVLIETDIVKNLRKLDRGGNSTHKPAIKSYYIKHDQVLMDHYQGEQFESHLKKLLKDIDVIMECAGSMFVQRNEGCW